jgi:hypothetical protein
VAHDQRYPYVGAGREGDTRLLDPIRATESFL